jgi:hypothetical protein
MTAAIFHTAPVQIGGRQFSVLEIVRPFLLLAILAFLAGFGGYLILGPPNVMSLGAAPQATAAAAAPAVSTDASAPAASPNASGEWNAAQRT